MEKNATYLTLAQIAAQAPGRPHLSAVWRWCRKGVLARNGERVKLRHIRIGARVFVPEGVLEEFAEKLAEADADYFDQPASPPPCRDATYAPRRRTEAQRRRDIDEARRSLEEKGVL